MMETAGVDPVWARRLPERLDALEDPALWFYGPAKVIAWGRRC
jgi:hypothetical protein